MTKVTNRRPLPALVFLLALTLLTSLVWWRVLHRGGTEKTTKADCSSASTQRSLPRPSQISLSVLNSTTRNGLAKSVAASLTKSGFKVTGYANDAGHAAIAGVAEVRFSADQKDAATVVGYYLAGATMVPLTTTDTTLIVSLGKQYSKLSTADTVQAAMARDKVVYLAPNGAPTASPTC